jgi:hypothetical protein
VGHLGCLGTVSSSMIDNHHAIPEDHCNFWEIIGQLLRGNRYPGYVNLPYELVSLGLIQVHPLGYCYIPVEPHRFQYNI